MENAAINQKHRERRKFFTVLPLLVIPFITLAFYALGGGKGNAADQTPQSGGFNAALPEAHLKEKQLDKLSYYEQASKDSAQREQMLKNDPYVNSQEVYYSGPENELGPAFNPFSMQENSIESNRNLGEQDYGSSHEEMIYQKLDELNAVLHEPAPSEAEPVAAPAASSPGSFASEYDTDIDRLEQMMLMMQSGEGGTDPEMEQINKTLERILDIQHPERVEERIKKLSRDRKGEVFSVSLEKKESPVTLLDNAKTARRASLSFQGQNGFYGLEEMPQDPFKERAIRAVVHETQVVVNGSTVKLRLLDDIYINGQLIPKNHLVSGTATLSGERLHIDVNDHIQYDNMLFPVQLSVYSTDGIQGIAIPGAIERDVAKNSGASAVQSISSLSLDPSLVAQAASTGIELTKSLLSKKIKLIKVTVKAGQLVLLKDEKQKM